MQIRIWQIVVVHLIDLYRKMANYSYFYPYTKLSLRREKITNIQLRSKEDHDFVTARSAHLHYNILLADPLLFFFLGIIYFLLSRSLGYVSRATIGLLDGLMTEWASRVCGPQLLS